MQSAQSRLSRFWPAVLGLFSAISLAGLAALVRLPADPEKALALGFSASRLALIIALLGLALAWAGMGLAAWQKPGAAAWFEVGRHRRLWDVVLLAAPLLALAAQALLAVFWGLSMHGENYRYVAYAQRLQSILPPRPLIFPSRWQSLLRTTHRNTMASK